MLEHLRTLITNHPKTAEEPLRVRLVGFGSYSLDVEIYAHVLTRDWSEFLAIREELLLEAMGVVEEAGTRLAAPVEIQFAAEDRAQGKKSEKMMGFELDEGTDAARNPR